MVRQAAILLTLLILMVASVAWGANITTHVDRNPVGLDESFRLIYEADGEPDGAPNFSPLEKDFEILGRNQSSSFNIINGSVSRKVEYSLTMMARRAGDLTIPAIPFGKDQSQPLQLKVVEQKANAAQGQQRSVYIEQITDTKEAFVQAQVLVTIRLYRSVTVSNASLSEPAPTGVEALIEKVGEDATYEKNLNGVRYLITERKYALYPQQSGTLTLDPIAFEGVVIENRGYFDPFNQGGRQVRLRSDAATVAIKPAAANLPNGWLPAADLKLEENWSADPTQLRIGDPLTRTITIRAKGLLASQLPEIDLQMPPEVKVYPDQPLLGNRPDEEGLTGIRQQKFALIPAQNGDLRIPPIDLVWWDTKANRARTAHLTGRTIRITGTAQAAPAPVQPAQQGATPASDTPQPVPTTGETVIDPGFWPWLSLFLGTGWLVTLILFLRRSKSVPKVESSDKGTGQKRGNESQLRKEAVAACRSNDPIKARDAVLHWGEAAFPHLRTRTLGSIADVVGGELGENLRSLQKGLYGSGNAGWDGAKTAELIGAFQLQTEQKEDISPLPSLYPADR